MKKLNKRLLELYSDRKQILFMSFLGYISYLAQDIIPSDPNIIYSTWGMIVVTAVGAGASIYAANKNASIAEGAADDAAIERDQQQALLEKQKRQYRSMKFKNPYENLENVYEDLTVNQQQAQFQAQQGAQQRANVMQGMRGAAGSSGIAGLAQALANQGALQTQRISASIGQQEARNQLAAARGAGAVQAAERGGDQWVQEAEMSRQATLLGMQMGATSGANQASMLAQANQMNAQMAQNEALVAGIGGIATSLAGADFGGGSSATGNADSGLYTQNVYTTGGGATNLVQEQKLDQHGNPIIQGY